MKEQVQYKCAGYVDPNSTTAPQEFASVAELLTSYMTLLWVSH